MKDQIIVEVLKYLVPTILSFILGFIVSQFRKFNGYLQVIKWTTRRMLIEDCQFYVKQGYMTVQESADLEKLWDIYRKKLKLNTEGEAWYKLAKDLPVRTDKNETK